MSVFRKAIDKSFDRYDKIRVGMIISDLDAEGYYEVSWLDGEPGGQSRVAISYPCFNNVGQSWGLECGLGKGVAGVFGFLSNNQAVYLTSLLSRKNNKGVGYDKTGKIQTGEFRITSSGGSQIYLKKDGSATVKSTNASIDIRTDGSVHVTAPNGFWVNNTRIDNGT